MLSHHQRSFLLTTDGKNIETHSQAIYREQEILEHSALNRKSPSNLSLYVFKELHERGGRTVSEPVGMEGIKKIRL